MGLSRPGLAVAPPAWRVSATLPVVRSVLLAGAVSAALGLGAAGCGRGARAHRPPHHAFTAAWAAATQQLCREKEKAIAGLGYVHITYGGIARVGLPTVERSLEGYLGRLLSVLREFADRQSRLTTPPARASAMRMARRLDAEDQRATVHLRAALTRVTTPAQLTAAFRTWLSALQVVSAQGNIVAQRLDLPACEAGSAGSTH